MKKNEHDHDRPPRQRDRDGTEDDGACDCVCGSAVLLVTLPAAASVDLVDSRPFAVAFQYARGGSIETECAGCEARLDVAGQLHRPGLRVVDDEREQGYMRPLAAAKDVARLWRDRQYRLTYSDGSVPRPAMRAGCACGSATMRLTYNADAYLRLVHGAVMSQVFAVLDIAPPVAISCAACSAPVAARQADVAAADHLLRLTPRLQLGR